MNILTPRLKKFDMLVIKAKLKWFSDRIEFLVNTPIGKRPVSVTNRLESSRCRCE